MSTGVEYEVEKVRAVIEADDAQVRAQALVVDALTDLLSQQQHELKRLREIAALRRRTWAELGVVLPEPTA